MTKSPLAVTLGLAALLANGCGTVCNLASGKDMTPYGGIRRDLGMVEPDAQASSNDTPHLGLGNGKGAVILLGAMIAAGATLGAAELSLTFVGDSLTLPLTSYVQERCAWHVQMNEGGYGIVTPPAANTLSSPSADQDASRTGITDSQIQPASAPCDSGQTDRSPRSPLHAPL